MKHYIIRLDDACEFRDVEKWDRIEKLLDKYTIKPLVGIIPHCEDTKLLNYKCDLLFWQRVDTWLKKGWAYAMHGYNHVYSTTNGGINPVNKKSEFAGVPLCEQIRKIQAGISIFQEHELSPRVFFAPAHTYDMNTIRAIKEASEIEIISDTFCSTSYAEYGLSFVPVQSGKVRNLPFKTVTFCYHPNTMQEKDYRELEAFIMKFRRYFVSFYDVVNKTKLSVLDRCLKKIYYLFRRMR